MRLAFKIGFAVLFAAAAIAMTGAVLFQSVTGLVIGLFYSVVLTITTVAFGGVR